jgi:hypothetical protein
MTDLKGYARSISEATGVTDPETLAEIEATMRDDIFHSTLDWQPRDVFDRGAREAWELVQYLRSPEGAAEFARLYAEMGGVPA